MNTEDLRCFVTLADMLNYRKAAQLLYMSQPALSRRIAALESECGFPLFERSTRSVCLTDNGLNCLEQARKCLKELELLDKQIETIRNPSTQQLTIGFTTIGHTLLLRPLLHAMKQHYENISVVPVHQKAQDLLKSIREKHVDIGLHCIYSLSDEEDFEFKPINHPGFSAKVPLSHPLSQKECLSLQDLRNQKILLFQREHDKSTYDAILKRLNKHGVGQTVIQVDGHAEVEFYMENGQAISLASAYPYPTENSKIIPVKELSNAFSVCAVYKKGNTDPLISTLIELLKCATIDSN